MRDPVSPSLLSREDLSILLAFAAIAMGSADLLEGTKTLASVGK